MSAHRHFFSGVFAFSEVGRCGVVVDAAKKGIHIKFCR